VKITIALLLVPAALVFAYVFWTLFFRGKALGVIACRVDRRDFSYGRMRLIVKEIDGEIALQVRVVMSTGQETIGYDDRERLAALVDDALARVPA
jgi:hypothetical protein